MSFHRVIAVLALLACSPAAPHQAPAPKPAGAVLVPAAELLGAAGQNDAAAVSDAVLRLVPVAGRYNVGISVVRRSQVDGQTPPDAIMHEAITEVYHILEGRGILVTGGAVDQGRPLAADNPVVRELIGPSLVGKTISSGTRQQVGPGDVVIIPPHTAHGFAELTTPRVVYLLIRIDPDKVLAPRSP